MNKFCSCLGLFSIIVLRISLFIVPSVLEIILNVILPYDESFYAIIGINVFMFVYAFIAGLRSDELCNEPQFEMRNPIGIVSPINILMLSLPWLFINLFCIIQRKDPNPDHHWLALMIPNPIVAVGLGVFVAYYIRRISKDSFTNALEKAIAFVVLIILWTGPIALEITVFVLGPDIQTEILFFSLAKCLIFPSVGLILIHQTTLEMTEWEIDVFSFENFGRPATFFYGLPPWLLTTLITTWVKNSALPWWVHLISYCPAVTFGLGAAFGYAIANTCDKYQSEKEPLLAA